MTMIVDAQTMHIFWITNFFQAEIPQEQLVIPPNFTLAPSECQLRYR